METIILNVKDMKSKDRSAAESIVGHPLDADQQLVITVRHSEGAGADGVPEKSLAELPDWCNVYHGLSEQEIDDVERVILTRANLSRSID